MFFPPVRKPNAIRSHPRKKRILKAAKAPFGLVQIGLFRIYDNHKVTRFISKTFPIFFNLFFTSRNHKKDRAL